MLPSPSIKRSWRISLRKKRNYIHAIIFKFLWSHKRMWIGYANFWACLKWRESVSYMYVPPFLLCDATWIRNLFRREKNLSKRTIQKNFHFFYSHTHIQKHVCINVVHLQISTISFHFACFFFSRTFLSS